MELILNGLAPYAIILRDVDSILCTGAIVAEEFFGDTVNDEDDDDDDNGVVEKRSSICSRKRKRRIPIIVAVGEANFAKLQEYKSLSVQEDTDDTTSICIRSGSSSSSSSSSDEEDGGGDYLNIRTPNLLRLQNTLSWEDATTLSKHPTLAEQLAIRTISRIASVSSPSSSLSSSSNAGGGQQGGGGDTTTTTSVIPITSAHIDAVTYIGKGGLLFAQKLVEFGGRVKVT